SCRPLRRACGGRGLAGRSAGTGRTVARSVAANRQGAEPGDRWPFTPWETWVGTPPMTTNKRGRIMTGTPSQLLSMLHGLLPELESVYSRATQSGKVGEIPTNHNSRFAPVIHPTLQAGIEAMVVAALAWLSA